MKQKVVFEYSKLIQYLHVGKEYDYQHILDMINYIEIHEVLDNPEIVAKYFLNK